MTIAYPYVWRWGVCDGKYPELGKRQGQRCRVLCRLGNNSAVIEFEDSAIFVTSRNGLVRSAWFGEEKC